MGLTSIPLSGEQYLGAGDRQHGKHCFVLLFACFASLFCVLVWYAVFLVDAPVLVLVLVPLLILVFVLFLHVQLSK